ncbi:putative ribonuclease H-like domain-containing protein [Tanacetum coccineum]
MTHPHLKVNFVPKAVLMKSGIKSLNTAGQNFSKAAVSVNTVRPINTTYTRPIVNSARKVSNVLNKAQTHVRRPFNKSTTNKNSNLKEKVNIVKGDVTTVGPKVVRNPQLELQEKGVIDSGCSRNITGNKSYLSDYEEIDGGFVAFGGDPKGSRITSKGKISTDTKCVILSPDFKLLDENHVLLRVPRKDNMYSVDLKNIVPSGGLTCLFAKATLDESNLWHRRLGHINFKTLNKLVRGNLVRGLPSKIFENNHTCVACQKGKKHKASCKTKTVSSISQPLQMLHMDLFGPTFVKGLMKKMYCLVVTDDYSRFSWVFFLATKDETSEILKTFITGIENLIDLKVKVIRCDNRTEFKNKVMNQLCEKKGIKREFSVARTPQQNRVAERKNRTLIEAARTIKADSKLPTTFWAEAVNTACYVQNRVLVIKPHNKTPYELFLEKKPVLSFMRPFGCPVTILNTIDHLGKFDGKADEGFFVGYSTSSKAYMVFNNRTRIVKENLHVKFSEKTPNIAGNGPNWLFDIDALTISMNYKPVMAGNQTNGNAGTKENIDAGQDGKKIVPDQKYILLPLLTSDPSLSKSSKDSPNARFKPSGEEEKIDSEHQENEDIYGCIDEPNMPNLEEIVYSDHDEKVGVEADMNNLATNVHVSPIPTTRVYKDHPLEQIIGDINSAPQTRRMTKNVTGHVEPKKKVWTLVDLPHGKRAIGTKWVYRNKKNDREAIKLFLAYASFMGFIMYQMDVKSAFLYGTIEEEVYVCQPPGFEDLQFPDKVYKVKKALYGLHQDPRAWYETLSTYLLENGFRRCTIDKTLFIKKNKGDILLLQVYVDDIIFGSTKKSLCVEFEQMMHKRFQMSSMRELTFFLRLQVKQKDDGIFISQDKYVAAIWNKFDFATIKTANTPIKTNKALLKDEEAEDVDVHLYRSMIGSLMYLTAFRPDIMFAVYAYARFQVTPKVSHLHAVKRIFKYLKGQHKLGLWYLRDSPFDLEAFSDSDYAGASLDKKSTTGGCQFLSKRLISWQCKKQTIVANSTTEAENPVFHSKTKHIEIRHHFIRDSYEKKLIHVIKIHTDHNVADLLIKAFDVSRLDERECISKQKWVKDKTVYKEWEDRMGRATTTSSSLEAEQDSDTTLVDKKKVIISETSIRSDLKLDDTDGIDCLPTTTVFAELERMGTMASAIICLATNQKFNLSKYIFDNMVKNLDGGIKFLMYPRFVQVFLDKQVEGMSKHKGVYVTPSHTKKVFANMKRPCKGFSGRVTPLFSTMMVQATEDMGADSATPTDSHSTPIISQPSSSKPQKKKSRRKQRKDSGPTEPVTDEAHVSTPSYDPPQSGEDSMQLSELMNLCTSLQEKVLDLEKAKTAQAKEITSLKKRVKQLEKRRKSRPSGLRRLRKVGSTSRVESSNDASLGAQEDASKQGRKIEDLDADAEVTLVNETQEMNDDNLMFDIGMLEEQELEFEKVKEPVVSVATTTKSILVSTAEVVTTTSVSVEITNELTLAQTLIEIKTAKPKPVTIVATTVTSIRPRAKGIIFHDQEEQVPASTKTFSSSQSQVKDKGKGIMVEPKVPLKKKDRVALNEEMARNLEARLQAELIEEERLARQKEEEANVALIES